MACHGDEGVCNVVGGADTSRFATRPDTPRLAAGSSSYLNARNSLLKKEIVSVGLLDKALLHPREIFYPATELNAASVILIHNHPSGDSSPSEKDIEVVEKIAQAGEIMGIPVIDSIILSEKDHYSFHEKLNLNLSDLTI